MKQRPAARILVFGPDDKLLLFQFSFEDGPLSGTQYWATPGGAVEPGESFEQAAQRELFEETGIGVPVGREIWRREAVFQIPSGEFVEADERFFAVRVRSTAVSENGQQPFERNFMKAYRWWSIGDLTTTEQTVYPEQLPDIFGDILALLVATGRG